MIRFIMIIMSSMIISIMSYGGDKPQPTPRLNAYNGPVISQDDGRGKEIDPDKEIAKHNNEREWELFKEKNLSIPGDPNKIL